MWTLPQLPSAVDEGSHGNTPPKSLTSADMLSICSPAISSKKNGAQVVDPQQIELTFASPACARPSSTVVPKNL